MFSLGTASLILAYLGPAVLLVAVLLGTRWSKSVKAALLALVGALYVATLQALPVLSGWPASTPLPQRFALLAYHVQEPDKASGRPGAVFLWAHDLQADAQHVSPRAYRLPFSAPLNAALVAAGDRLRKGEPQIGEMVASEGPVAGHGNGPPTASPIVFYGLPDAAFPAQ